jgi:aminotransferase
VTISALSKTYAVTGWRVGWAVAPESLVGGIRKVHDFLSVGAPTPLQHAGVTALNLPDAYYARTVEEYAERRELMMKTLWDHGFEARPPAGAYYVMAGIEHLGLGDDTATALHLVREVGVATVPGSSFFSRPELGAGLVRFSFCKRLETLHEAARRLGRLEHPSP